VIFSDPRFSVVTRKVLIYLDLESLLQACLVCQSWKDNITSDRYLWQKHFRFYKNKICSLVFEQRPPNGACPSDSGIRTLCPIQPCYAHGGPYQGPCLSHGTDPDTCCQKRYSELIPYHDEWLDLFSKFDNEAQGVELQAMVRMFHVLLNYRLCTFTQTQYKFKHQTWYHCNTCQPNESDMGICSVCVFTCHATHDVSYVADIPCYCDCGDPNNAKTACSAIQVKENPQDDLGLPSLSTFVKCTPIYVISKYGTMELFNAYARMSQLDMTEKIKVRECKQERFGEDIWIEYETTPLSLKNSFKPDDDVVEMLLDSIFPLDESLDETTPLSLKNSCKPDDEVDEMFFDSIFPLDESLDDVLFANVMDFMPNE